MKKNNRKKQKLSVKILGVLFVTFVPVFVILALITGSMIANMYEQILDANKNEMNLFINQFDNDAAKATEEVKNVAVEYRTTLYGLKDRGVIFYNLWRCLDEIRANHSIVDILYLVDGENIAFTHGSGIYSRAEEEQFKQAIVSQDVTQWKNFSYHMLKLNGENYIQLHLLMDGYQLGYFIHTDRLMERFIEKEEISNTLTFTNPGTADRKILSVQSKETGIYLVRTISDSYIYRAFPARRIIILVAAALSFVLFPVQWSSLRRYVLKPLSRISDAMKKLTADHLDYQMPQGEESEEFAQIGQGFNTMADQIKDLKIEAYERDIEKLRIENINLRLQVNPHMLLNSLNMIYSLSKSRNTKGVEDMSMCLSKYFRYVLYHDKDFSTIKEELDFVSSYMDIQKIRFPGAFSYVYDVDDTLFEEKIPTMLIQNFVENSIKYALNMETEIDIMVIVKSKGQQLSISVIDTGNGMDEVTLEKLRSAAAFEDERGKHIGIWNCRKRLQMYYGDSTDFSMSSAIGKGTQVWIQIPHMKKEDV